MPAPSRARRTSMRIGHAALVLLGASAVLSVNTFPVITNDGLVYIEHSRDLAGYGWVTLGYRQAGYPLFLSMVRQGSEWLGAEPLLGVAVVQRAALLIGLVLAWRAWGYWVLPFSVFLLAPGTIAYTNFALTESLALPLALGLAVAVYSCIVAIGTESPPGRRKVFVIASLVALGALALYALKFTNIGFAVLPALLVVAAWPTAYRRPVVIVFVSFVVAMALFTLAVAAENQDELGSFRPTVQLNGADYFWAWSNVFVLHPENRDDPELTRFYDDGQVSDFIRQSAESAEYPEVVAVREEEVSDMLDAAGISSFRSRAEAAFFALAGGRFHDIQSRVDRVTFATYDTVYEAVYQNRVATGPGPSVFDERYNDGVTPDVVITDPLAKKLPFPPNRKSGAVLLAISGLIAAYGLFGNRTSRLIALCASVPLVIHAIGFGSIWADNFRFMLPSIALSLGLVTALARHLHQLRRSQPLPGPT